jgi:SanA protein
MLLLLGVALLASPVLWRQVLVRFYEPRVHDDVSTTPPRKTAIVFGAAVFRGDRLSTVLRDRMDAAIELYHQGKVTELLLSGDGASAGYDEPNAMRLYALQSGVDDADIRLDLGGRRTYDTCYRAHRLFDVSEAVLVTQEFHLTRALFVCDQLGVDAVGVSADRRQYRSARWYEMREIAASFVALTDVLQRREPAITTVIPPQVLKG